MSAITAVGVGLERGQLTLEAVSLLASGARVVLHTGRVGCAQWLEEEGIAYETLDALYENCEDFDEHARLAAEHVMRMAETEDVVYAVYDVRDRSVLELSRRVKGLRIVAGPAVEGALLGQLDGSTRMLEASDWANYRLSPRDNSLIRELDSRQQASEVKLKLMECYPDDTRCLVLNGLDGGVARVPLYDLDRLKAYDHRTCVLVPAQRDLMKLERYGFEELLEIMRVLQGPGGCPWDREQTHQSLRPFMLEETYEAIDAINEGDMDHLYDELGDLLMQVVMQAEIGRRHAEFDIWDATTAICEKMIQRHSHIFGGDQASDADSVLDLWASNKMKERGQSTRTEVLQEVSRSLPALMRGCKLAEKAARAGVVSSNVASLNEDAARILASVCQAQDQEATLGDALFLICALARNVGVDLEIALNEALDRFVDRFAALEQELLARGISLPGGEGCADEYWNRVKLSKNTSNQQELTNS